MNRALTTLLVTEVLDRVGDVHLLAADPCLLEAPVQDASRWSDKRVAVLVLAVAGLLADQDNVRMPRALSHHRLGRAFP